MSVRWDVRVDRFQLVDSQVEVVISRVVGSGFVVRITMDIYEYLDSNEEPVLTTEVIQDDKLFPIMYSLENFLSRFRKIFFISPDSLIERSYFFGRQNSHYDKEVN